MEKTQVKQTVTSEEVFEGQKKTDLKGLERAIQHNKWLLEALDSLVNMVNFHTNLIQTEKDLIQKNDEEIQEKVQ